MRYSIETGIDLRQIDWKRLRADFPITRRWVYLDHASAGPLPKPVYEEVKRTYWDALHYGDVPWKRWLEKKEKVREKFARLIHADADEVAFVHSTSEGMNLIADLIGGEGDVLASSLEFPASTVPWLHRRTRVRFIRPEDGKISLESIRRELDPGVKTIVTSCVQYQNGFKQDLTSVGKIKGRRYLVVNATQALGVFPIDVRAWRADFLAAASYKWLLAGYGGGLLYVRKKWLKKFKPSFAGWRSRQIEENFDNRNVTLKQSASRYEYGCPSLAVIFTMSAALDYLTAIGIDRIAGRVLELTDYAIQRLEDIGLEITSPLERKYRSGIVVFKVKHAKRIVQALLKRRIYVSPRGEGIRVAPHFYNSFADIDRFIINLKKLI